MENEQDKQHHEENLRDENEFLRMKLMLEHGADIGGNSDDDLPAEVENEFLRNVMAFEEQFSQHKQIRIFDKIGKPNQFKPAFEIPDADIEKAWKGLRSYLNDYQVDLDVCSPNISARELYRFTVEELFEKEMDDIDVPGWTTNFIYDEFYPDPVYENEQKAHDYCIRTILSSEPFRHAYYFKDSNIRLNDQYPLTRGEVEKTLNQFKRNYDNLDLIESNAIQCFVKEDKSWVTGTYFVIGSVGRSMLEYKGHWKVYLEPDKEFGGWEISDVQIEGLSFLKY